MNKKNNYFSLNTIYFIFEETNNNKLYYIRTNNNQLRKETFNMQKYN